MNVHAHHHQSQWLAKPTLWALAPSRKTCVMFVLAFAVQQTTLRAQTVREALRAASQPPPEMPAEATWSPSDAGSLQPQSAAAERSSGQAKEAAQGQATAQTVQPSTGRVTNDNPNQAGEPEAKNGQALEGLEEVIPPDSAESDVSEEQLALADVIASLYRAYPEIAQARLEANRASGALLGTYGAFDTKLEGYSLSEPTGFYRNYRQGIGVARQTWWGGYLSAGYRLGRGQFQPWYKERETNEGGEFKLGLGQALLQGRAIDPERVAVFQASLARRAAVPIFQQALLDSAREAALLYWQWVAIGNVLEAQRELLNLAEMRGEQFEIGVEAGKFAEIDLILNQQLIAERQLKVFETEQKFRASAFKLSLFLRDAMGQPQIPNDEWLPRRFPKIEPPPEGDFQQDLAAALSRRPEPQLLQIEIQQIEFDRRLANNNLLPTLDLVAEASQDMGLRASSSNDKGQFQLLVGVQGEVPIQRRKARGKIQETTAKIAQLFEKLRLQRDKIGAELQTAYNALMLAAQMVEQSEVALRAAIETLTRYRFAFDRGKIDLIYLNLLETKVNETEIKLVEAQQFWFSALADMQAALGLDPLDQAMLVDALPPSTVPGPGRLPSYDNLDPDALDQDWQRRAVPMEIP